MGTIDRASGERGGGEALVLVLSFLDHVGGV